jgi:hypothetical protein
MINGFNSSQLRFSMDAESANAESARDANDWRRG